jgi:7-cyano-7-deazaguanine synthase in queuosine biosynthesis
MSSNPQRSTIPEVGIDVVEDGCIARNGRKVLVLGRDVKFSTSGLQSYAYAGGEPLIFDAMVLAAAVEYGDKIIKRPGLGWARRISLRIPVHDPDQWNAPVVAEALQDAVEFLTGDNWAFEFVRRSCAADLPQQYYLDLPVETKAVIPYSDGMDSRAVAGILGHSLGDKLVRVRIGSKNWDRQYHPGKRAPFTAVPYSVPCKTTHREGSTRTRGFKFSLISCIAAYLTDAKEIIIPESGQGAIGPALLSVGHAYPDYRNHPLFGKKMERFVNRLFGTQIAFQYPRIWSTKGETLAEFISICGGNAWASTKSCWQGNYSSSVNHKLRQCGVCAACMLRRVSVHAAGLKEKPDVYVITDMSAGTLDAAADDDFHKLTGAFRQYAIAGVLHMDHLADMAEADAIPIVVSHAALIASALNLSSEETEKRLASLLRRHAEEWKKYLETLGPKSFVKRLVRARL